ncbi:MAG: serine/threonine protein kinase [Proteobacteria bacterium]|nr:serine/threonine protein kinase [Pseudomonadota bacterium]
MSRATEPLPDSGDSLSSGRYALLDLIGEGASAAVYRAKDTSLDLPRAVKVLRPTETRGDDQRRRLRAEARALSELSHPNILRMFDFGAEGTYDYVVMQLAEGGSLSEVIKTQGPMEASLAVDYTLQVLGALAHAHSRGIVHRDVKPQNILLDGEGKALLADFGIALVVDDDTRSTRTGVAMGTMAFMAPEQRLDARSVGPSADLYAVATTLYNLLTDDNPVDLFAAAEDSPRWRGIDPRIVAVIQHAVRYDPATRYQDADTMYTELLKAREDLTTAVPIVVSPGPKPVPEAHPTGVTLVAPPTEERVVWPWLVAAGLLALALFGVWTQSRPASVAPPTEIAEAAVEPLPAPEPVEVSEPTPVEPEPEVPAAIQPAPKVATVKPKPPVKAGPFPLGRWRGTMRGRTFDLTLSGTPKTIVGTMIQRNGDLVVPTEIEGSFHEGTGVLKFHDKDDNPDAIDVYLKKTDSGFTGEFVGRHVTRKGPILLIEYL